ncbi:GAF and ANTAR domain-containing protein [Actinoplanes sp. Pm04-4]|uniref:GAF and ANTAR domain-containing protein n=1 Tax=Paractinoplanes pyxinae TaxID=2997416 RepID=A0ABT4BCM0_9ACTN|nr:GAF and ANTAR domain-containing protein [Actinoplanes pyxinae]MCY1143742.1 GAF and ANTAR domain-containing protein [Actinoplanes pyxinae]
MGQHGEEQGWGKPSAQYGGDIDDDHLAVRLSELARSLQERGNVQDTLQGITDAAADSVPGAQCAALTVITGRRKVETPAYSADVARRVDEIQYVTGQGPCLDAVLERRTIRLSDVRSEQRWPRFTGGLVELGIRSMLSLQLYVTGDNLGAMNLYSSEPDAFDDESEHVGLLFATHAAVAMAGAQQREDLLRAMSLRDVIGQAKGILMERHKLTGDQAFALLVKASQTTNTKLVEVARSLVETGELSVRRR